METGESGIRRFHLDLKNEWEYYLELLVFMRKELGKSGGYVNHKPQLPASDAGATMAEKFVELVLTNFNNLCIELRFLVTNLCPVGIKIRGYTTWFEFAHDGETYFADAGCRIIRLPFSGFSSETDDDIAIDFWSISDSMEMLANLLILKLKAAKKINFTQQFQSDVETLMAPIIRITSESLKFKPISILVVTCHSHVRCVMPPWLESYSRHWGTLSEIWRLKDVDPKRALRLLGETGLVDCIGRPLQTIEELGDVFGLLNAVQGESTSG